MMKLKTNVLEEMTGKVSEMKQQVQIMVRPPFFLQIFFFAVFLANIMKDKKCGNRFCLIVIHVYM